jgi:putative ABC transport system permease protein
MAGLVNWSSQVASIAKFGLMGVPQRLGSVAAAVCGIAGVVTVLVGVLSIAAGFRRVMEASGSPDAVIVMRSGADTEMVSGILGPQTRIIADTPGVARGPDGPLSSAELFVIVDLPKLSTGKDVNVPFRGVEQAALRVRDKFKIVQGRNFEWGKNEVIAGVGAAREFSGLGVGDRMKVGSREWPVVGIFSAGGGAAESEVWTDARVLQGAYNRGDSFQSVYVRLDSAADFDAFKASLTTNPQLNVEVSRQADYYAEQSTSVNTLITTLGYLVASLMAVGAVFGAFNTMYSSVSTRTREIATLRALGFGNGAVVAAVMLESVALSIVGGTAGAVIAYAVFNGFHATTMNMQSFSQVTFAFVVSRQLLVQGIVWATLIGLFGGLWPALRAARMPIAAGLRDL